MSLALADGGSLPAPTKRQHSGSSYDASLDGNSKDDESHIDDTGDDDGGDFEQVVNKKKTKKKRQEGSQHSQGIVKISTTSRTVLFVPTNVATNLRKINRQLLSDELDAVAPNLIIEARVNVKKNIIAVETRAEAAVLDLLITSKLCGFPVRAFLPHSKNTRVGVLSDVDPATTDERLMEMMSCGMKIVQVKRLGPTTAVKVVFDGDTLPAHVKIGLVRHSVRPFVPRPLQCRLCFRIGHIAAACPNSACCPNCSKQHTEVNCTAPPKCVNCSQPHAATSGECPNLQREKETCSLKARQNITFSEAAKLVQDNRKKNKQGNKAKTTNKAEASKPPDADKAAAPPSKPTSSHTPSTPLPATGQQNTENVKTNRRAYNTVARGSEGATLEEPFPESSSVGDLLLRVMRGTKELLKQFPQNWAKQVVLIMEFAEQMLRNFSLF